MRECRVKTCNRPVQHKGLCSQHVKTHLKCLCVHIDCAKVALPNLLYCKDHNTPYPGTNAPKLKEVAETFYNNPRYNNTQVSQSMLICKDTSWLTLELKTKLLRLGGMR